MKRITDKAGGEGEVKLVVNRYSLDVVPEGNTDEAFLEEVLGLVEQGDSVPLTRRNAMNLSCWGWAEAKKRERAGKAKG